MWVKSLESMEDIVSRIPNLVWDGWDVVAYIKHKNPVVFKDARFRDGKWWRTRTISLTENGWWLPIGQA